MSRTEDTHAPITQAWRQLRDAIMKLINDFESVEGYKLTSEEYMELYTIVYNLSTQATTFESQRLYDYYKRTHENYISSKILPSLVGKIGESFLEDLVKSWEKYKKLAQRLSGIFSVLDIYFCSRKQLPNLKQASFKIFHESVYEELDDKVKSCVMSMINEEREGKSINQAIVKSVLEIYVEMDDGSMSIYEKDFQKTLHEATSSFYSEKVTLLADNHSRDSYMCEVEMYKNQEKERAISYLPYIEESKLPKIVEHELLSRQAKKARRGTAQQ